MGAVISLLTTPYTLILLPSVDTYTMENRETRTAENGGHQGEAQRVQQQRVQQQLEHTELQFRKLMQNSPSCIVILKGAGMIIEFVNQPMLKAWKRDFSIVDRSLYEVAPELKGQHFLELLHKVYTTGEIYRGKEEKAIIVKDGVNVDTYFDYVLQPVIENDGTIAGVAVVAHDITGQVTARLNIERLQQETERQKRVYEAITSSTPDLMYVIDLNCRFTYANQALLAMWGKTWEESAGRSLLELGYEPWHATMHEQEIDTVVTTRKPIRGEVSFPHATLGRRIYDYIFVPVVNAEGEVEAIAGTTRDITDIKQAEEALKESGDRLEALVEERTRELIRSNADLQQFAHVASHDLREPIRKVSMFADRLRYELPGVSERARDYLDRIERSAKRMSTMVNGILQYAASDGEHEIKDVDLNTVVGGIEDDLELVIQQTGATLVHDKLLHVQGAPVLLHQLFYNLVNNSLKFSRAGVKPVITIRSERAGAADVAAEEGLISGKAYLKVTLQDNGIGFDQKNAGRIFGTFSRLHSKDLYEGTGLGLALCRKIVERHGGIIRAEGKEGEGATFIMYLAG
jgi:PAS domain S-box-containing protein